jgi:hypothetical protein
MTARFVVTTIVALLASAPTVAVAAEPRDGAHGRIDGDMAVEAGLGASFGPRSPKLAADLRLRYLSMAGIFGTYEDGPLVGSRSDPERVVATGVELRPLFLARWLTGRYSGNPRLDLALDSLGIEIGAVFQEPPGASFGARPGLQAGLGVELPIFPRASGPFVALHGGARWSDDALGGHPLRGPSDRALFLVVVLAWQQVFGTRVVDLGDGRMR